MESPVRAFVERFYALPLSEQTAIQKAYYTQLYGFFPEKLDKTIIRKITADQAFAEDLKNEIAFGLFLEKYFHEHSIF